MAVLALTDTALTLVLVAHDRTSGWGWTVHVGLALVTGLLWLGEQRYGKRLPMAGLALAVCSLAGTALLALRHDYGPWGWAETFGLLLMLITVVRRAQGRLMPVSAAGLCVALCVQPVRGLSWDVAMVFGFLQGLLAAAAVVTGLYLRFQMTAREQQLAAVRAEQRTEFARDLHDFVAHHVTGIVVQAQGARYVAGTAPGMAVDALQEIEEAGTKTMSAMRRMVGVLRQEDDRVALHPAGGLGDLARLVDEFAAGGGPVARLSGDDAGDDLPLEVTTSAYRVVMEALTNVRKHAGAASEVEVSIERTPRWLFVRVVNDGPQVPAQRSGKPFDRSGFGLVGLDERVGAIGGRLRTEPGIDGGWVVEAALPLTVGTDMKSGSGE